MRISGGSPSIPLQADQTDAMKAQYQVRVLKQALDSQKTSADQLLKLLEPKGKIVDIRA